ncbi:hypothetical protein C0991_005290 [Blastosporella zonata]|nr:hypothetical protein C0991_005290 [Blastosporella zonata]
MQAFGAAADIKWVNDGKGSYNNWGRREAQCQPSYVVTSDPNTFTNFTQLIAIYTFVGVWWRIGMGKQSVRVAKIIISLMWLFIILMVIAGNATHPHRDQLYESPTPMAHPKHTDTQSSTASSSFPLVLRGGNDGRDSDLRLFWGSERRASPQYTPEFRVVRDPHGVASARRNGLGDRK